MIVYVSPFQQRFDQRGNHFEGKIGRFARFFTALMDLPLEEPGDACGTGLPARGVAQGSLFEPGEIHRLRVTSLSSLRRGIAWSPVRQHALHATKLVAAAD
jgi:hypothetical protein